MRNYVDSKYIRPMVASGSVQELDATIAARAESHLMRSFPFSRSSTIWVVDWTQVSHSSLSWLTATDEETLAWAASTSMGHLPWTLLLFRGDQPCLLGRLDFMVGHLEMLISGAPGNRLLFAVDLAADGGIVFSQALLEYNGIADLKATC